MQWRRGKMTRAVRRHRLWRVTYNGENRPIRWENLAAESNNSSSVALAVEDRTILSMTASFGVGIGGKVKIPFFGEVSALIKGPQITWTFPSVSFSKDCDDTNPSLVVTLGGVSGDIGGTMSIGMGPGITVGYWSRYVLQVDVEFADNSLAVVRHGWISGGVLNVDFGVVNLDGEFVRFDFTKELK